MPGVVSNRDTVRAGIFRLVNITIKKIFRFVFSLCIPYVFDALSISPMLTHEVSLYVNAPARHKNEISPHACIYFVG